MRTDRRAPALILNATTVRPSLAKSSCPRPIRPDESATLIRPADPTLAADYEEPMNVANRTTGVVSRQLRRDRARPAAGSSAGALPRNHGQRRTRRRPRLDRPCRVPTRATEARFALSAARRSVKVASVETGGAEAAGGRGRGRSERRGSGRRQGHGSAVRALVPSGTPLCSSTIRTTSIESSYPSSGSCKRRRFSCRRGGSCTNSARGAPAGPHAGPGFRCHEAGPPGRRRASVVGAPSGASGCQLGGRPRCNLAAI
jgi:hypothetical protein